ncbi:hypothetical protein [Sulfuricurvum sp.]|uniref:hypothetical protein n=1 Tax=Sulfuricurvum sp. TaxID=2025608 RepID=UPI002626E3E8|nr:hypothetical protein [Sulfuricurvum sp.]MDD3596772.1 hypothetical protein [Sulfuricurvum sp.]
MLQKIVLFIILVSLPIYAQVLNIDDNNQKILRDAGISIIDISSIKSGNIICSDKKSLVLLAKIKLENDISKYKIFDVYDSKQKFLNNQKNLIAYLIITDDHVDILSEWVCKSCSSALNDFYRDPLRLIVAKKVSKIIPNLISKKIASNQEGIIIPTGAGIDTYVFWNGKNYVLYFPDEIP